MTEKIKLITKQWLPVFLWAYFIFFMSSIPGKDIPPLFPYQDIVYHTIIYGIFAVLLKRALNHSFIKMDQLRQIFLVIFLGMIYAFTDEFHQRFVPQRSFSLLDLSTDAIGLFMGAMIHKWQR